MFASLGKDFCLAELLDSKVAKDTNVSASTKQEDIIMNDTNILKCYSHILCTGYP